MKLLRIDHVSINVTDLPAAKAFFLDLGLEILGEWEVEGDRVVDRLLGLDNIKDAAVMLGAPGGQVNIELVQFITPADESGDQQLPANALGIRHIALAFDDLTAVVASLKAKGTEFISEIEDLGGYKLCYARGPEGIILELAEPIQ
jgi:catechol 2,3-dioxygenase-like lactoylglutathione lyase family enzyme